MMWFVEFSTQGNTELKFGFFATSLLDLPGGVETLCCGSPAESTELTGDLQVIKTEIFRSEKAFITKAMRCALT